MKEYLQTIADGTPLSRSEAEGAMRQMMSGDALPEHMAALLMGVRARDEKLDELVGFTKVMREFAVDVDDRLPFEERPWMKAAEITDATIAAHLSLPFGTEVELTNPENGRTHVVTVLDRGPCHGSREFDISEAAAIKLGFKDEGVASLEYRIIKLGDRLYPALKCGRYSPKQLKYG